MHCDRHAPFSARDKSLADRRVQKAVVLRPRHIEPNDASSQVPASQARRIEGVRRGLRTEGAYYHTAANAGLAARPLEA